MSEDIRPGETTEDAVARYQRGMQADTKHYPYDEMMEMSLLGAILLGGRKTLDNVEFIVTERDFYRGGHQGIWTAMKEVVAETGGACDIVLLRDRLIVKNQLEVCGGLAYLMQLAEIVPTTSNADWYAKNVKKLSQRRNIVIQSEYAMMQAQRGTTTPDEICLTFAQGTDNVVPTNTVQSGSDVFRQGIENIKAGKRKGINTGFSGIDSVVGGLRNGELIVIGGRPSMGKSSLGLQYAINSAIQGKGSLFISAEMSMDMISQRMIQIMSGVDAKNLFESYISERDRQRIQDTQSTLDLIPLYFSTETPVTVSSIRAKARELQRDGKLNLIIVDYLQMIDTGKSTEGRTRDIGIISRGLKNIAKEFDIPLVALSSLSRATEQRNDKRPIMSDLRESGDIESDADVIQFLYRPEYYDSDRKDIDPNLPSECEVITAKNRNGTTGVSILEFNKRFARFEE
jgi:replicative DNA helicase